jgi:beta-mannosidase
MNSLAAEWVKDRWWLYRTEFNAADISQRIKLQFDGVDYKCRVYLNGVLLGTHEGALTPFEFDIKDIVSYTNPNALCVIVEHAPDEMGQIGITGKTKTQRQRFDYKWDFCTRLVNIGIYRPVKLVYCGNATIESYRFAARKPAAGGIADLSVGIAYKGDFSGSLNASLCYRGREVYRSSTPIAARGGSDSAVALKVSVDGVKLWHANGCGEPDTYALALEIVDGSGSVSYSQTHTIGFRDIEFVQNEGAPDGSLKYTCVLNGKRLYLRGFNITPLDQLLGSETDARYRELVRAAKDANANIIRVWGGGIIESETFYDLCSQNGILVWQDMIQSSSGINNEPAESPEFLRLLEDEVRFAVRQRRNYPCLAVLCGGNELFGSDGRPVTNKNKNIALIEKIVNEEYPGCHFLPSTASGPAQEADLVNAENNHDIHGPWLFLGAVGHFEFYNTVKCLFAGEFGCDGMASYRQLKKILPKKRLKVTDMAKDAVWRHHGDWWDASGAVGGIFGKVGSLKKYIRLSRFIQAEALSYAVGAHRRRAFYQSGCMVWQLNEMFPNVSCTTLKEYYGGFKPAYYAVKRAYGCAAVSFRYDKLIYSPGEMIDIKLYATSDFAETECEVRYKWRTAKESGGGSFVCRAGDGKSAEAGSIAVVAGRGTKYVFLEAEIIAGGRAYKNAALVFVKNGKGICESASVNKYLKNLTGREAK